MADNKFWHEIVFAVQARHLDLAESVLYDLGALSVTLQDAGEQPLLEPAPGATPVWDSSFITGLFAQDKNPADLLRAARLALEGVAADFALRRVENQDWERVWMEDYRPMHFGRRLSVYPAHIPPADSSRINIILDPGLAFGTGTHPTTALCLRWLDACELEGKTCIDYGCGSGILAVAALKLGASRVYAADIDTQALTATRQNAERNRVISGLLIHTPDQIGAVQADVLLANILSNTIIQLAAVLTALLKPGGSLVLSGILATQAAAVRAAFIPAFDFGLEETVDGWVLLAGIKKSDQKR